MELGIRYPCGSIAYMTDYEDILSKQLEQLKQTGSYRYFLDVDKSAKDFPRFYYEGPNGEQKTAVNWCTNDYLCMSVHEEIIDKLCSVAHRSGVGSGGTRNISGTTIYHRKMATTFAGLLLKKASLTFDGAYFAKITNLSSLWRGTHNSLFT